jgi:membrane-associated phospholipid phosphatase
MGTSEGVRFEQEPQTVDHNRHPSPSATRAARRTTNVKVRGYGSCPASDTSIVLDPIVTAAGVGLVLSPVAGKALLHGQKRLPQRWRRAVTWLLIAVAVATTIAAELWLYGRVKEGVFTLLLGAVPGAVAFVVWRTALASALVCLVPLYFGIGAQTLGRPLHTPEIALDRAISVEPGWMLVYGSLYVFVLLPLLVVRQEQLLRRAMQAYVTVLSLAYIGFVMYPTAAPRSDDVLGHGFAAWCLRLQYSLDQPYNCFPSLHVAHSFVSALTCYRVHRGVGIVAVVWASLVGVSTLYTKQHYAVDVIAGALIAHAAYVVFVRSYPRESITESDRRLAPQRALCVVGIFACVVACFWAAYRIGLA